MTEALLVSNAVLWVAVIALGVIAVALARQLGILYERIAPAGALVIDRGPGVGAAAPLFEMRDLLGRAVKLGGLRGDRKNTVLLFVSPSCPMCKKLLPIVRSILRSEPAAALVLASDGDEAEQRAFVRREKLEQFPYLLSRELGMAYQVGKLPYAVLIDADGVIRAKGLVNTREHFESLFVASEHGVGSLQDYLRAERA
ncbi:MAG: methylamine dehydrogenase accessory protein MauD [Proteobacteria bacterium]|jgi:methylamine dehydrogenase accessory protein MauD|nr:methylamine dehydrogenase accessory protein MauD [Pseudomonadota bacterium]